MATSSDGGRAGHALERPVHLVAAAGTLARVGLDVEAGRDDDAEPRAAAELGGDLSGARVGDAVGRRHHDPAPARIVPERRAGHARRARGTMALASQQPDRRADAIATLLVHQHRLRERVVAVVRQGEQHPAARRVPKPISRERPDRTRVGACVALAADLELAPVDAELQPRAERLEPRLLGGEPRREVRRRIATAPDSRRSRPR